MMDIANALHQIFTAVEISAATFYLSYVLAYTDGPANLFTGIRHGALGGLTKCIYCLAPWIAAIMVLMSLTFLNVVVEVFAIAGAAMLLYRYTGASHT